VDAGLVYYKACATAAMLSAGITNTLLYFFLTIRCVYRRAHAFDWNKSILNQFNHHLTQKTTNVNMMYNPFVARAICNIIKTECTVHTVDKVGSTPYLNHDSIKLCEKEVRYASKV
jgi:hypothetical protein